MAITYPCQVGLPEDIDPFIKGIIFLCCDFQIISQHHDGVACADKVREDKSMIWAVVSDRGEYRFGMYVHEDPNWFELRICLSTGGRSKDFLRVIYRQNRSLRKPAPHLGWHFSASPETNEMLRRWVRIVWPEQYSESLEVDGFRSLIPPMEQKAASSAFMSNRVNQLFGWFSQLRTA